VKPCCGDLPAFLRRLADELEIRNEREADAEEDFSELWGWVDGGFHAWMPDSGRELYQGGELPELPSVEPKPIAASECKPEPRTFASYDYDTSTFTDGNSDTFPVTLIDDHTLYLTVRFPDGSTYTYTKREPDARV
jgi:hypothetical protein